MLIADIFFVFEPILNGSDDLRPYFDVAPSVGAYGESGAIENGSALVRVICK